MEQKTVKKTVAEVKVGDVLVLYKGLWRIVDGIKEWDGKPTKHPKRTFTYHLEKDHMGMAETVFISGLFITQLPCDMELDVIEGGAK